MEKIIRILLVGDSNIGKSSFMLKYDDNNIKLTSASTSTTFSFDFRIKHTKINNQPVRLQLWDTSGSHRFKYITTAYFKGANIILLCYSVTDKDSFINVDFWINEIAMYCTYINHVSLIALQTDSPNRIISKNEGTDLAAKYNIPYYEVSSYSNENVNSTFETAVGNYLKQK